MIFKFQVSGFKSGFLSVQFVALFCILLFAFFLQACSVPNLESPECAAARQSVREFYSYHFGNEMKFTAENLKAREKFLSPELTSNLQKFLTDSDPFTLTSSDDSPKAFRVGGCQTIGADKAELQVLLFWKEAARSEQREIKVEAVRDGGAGEKWLVNNIFNDAANLGEVLNHE
jgi:hypothetical protein